MKERAKAGILTGIIAGSTILFAGCNSRKNQEKEPELEEKETITEVVPTEDVDSYSLYTNDENMDYLGEVVVSPDIFDILDENNISLSDYPNISSDMLQSYQFEDLVNQKGLTNDAVNMRTGPGTEYDLITTLSNNSTVQLIAKCENGWYMVQCGSKLGFVRGDFIHEINDQSIIQQMYDLPELIPMVQATEAVNIRPEPNTSKPEYSVLQKDHSLEMVRRLDNGWYEVVYDGKTAYVCGDYVREAYAVAGPFDKVAFINQNTYMSDEPFGESTTFIPQFESVQIYREIEGYYYVECNGYVGFVPKSACTDLTGTFVVVDTSAQTLTLYRDNQILLVTDVVTGKDTSQTDIGLHDIDAKTTNAWLTGADYSVQVDYWMPFNGGEGLHDAKWRDQFGGSIYHEHGSHGCVNMPPEDTPFIYENLEVGNKVLVKE